MSATDLPLGTLLRVYPELKIVIFVDNNMTLSPDEYTYTTHEIDHLAIEEVYQYGDGYTTDLDSIYEEWRDDIDYDVDENTLAKWWEDYKGQIKHKKCICIYTDGLASL